MADTESDITDIPKDHLSERFLEGYAAEDDYLGEEEEEYQPFAPLEIALRSEDFISGPFRSRSGTIPLNILEFDFSYGYDCKKYYNLVVPDADTIMFISGNLINFFDVPTKSLTFRRSAFGGGLGHMTKNPNEALQHIAIGENGDQPPIIVYEWPTLDIVCLLREGTAKCYNHLNYSPNGDLLVSQGGDPDHLITVWNWPKSHILLRTKSYVNDVYRVLFSPYCPGQLSTCGLSHIKFWKMARTFTGLKLQGELGRFGKTEYSDILGIYPMPDEKVISGCSWGNILVWEAGLIKLEVFRKLRKKCHEGPIVQFDFIDGELWTVSMDGSVRVWHYDTIDQADPPDDDRVVQIEPIFDFRTPNVQFMCIARRSNSPEDTFYYAQDGNGGLWLIDLTTDLNVTPSEQLYVCHAGSVVDIAACPHGTYLVSLGMDGRLQLYDYVLKELLFVKQFPAKGVCMIWLPITAEPTGDVLILGFDDGCLRVIVLTIQQDTNEYTTTTIQITKPHNKPLRCMSMNETEEILVTAAEDKTIFVYKIQNDDQDNYLELLPIGYVHTTDIVTYITFHNTEHYTVILGCESGFIDIISLPHDQQDYTTITYILHVRPVTQRFTTYKSQIRRDIKLREIAARKAKKREKKRLELEAYKKENPGLEVDEDIFLADSESEEKLEPLFIPEVPNKVLWIQHTENNTLWLSMAGYDAGYIYEYHLGQKDEIPYRFRMVYDADDIEISSFLYNYNKKYLFFAMQNGEIRINKVKPDYHDLSDYWQLSMHDNYKGYIPRMCFSYDEKYFFTCGHDGNIFSYMYNPEDDDYCDSSIATTRRLRPCELECVEDVNSYTNLSLEEAIVKAEEDRKTKLANDHKKEYLDRIHRLKKEFQILLKKNQKLMKTQKIPREKFELDYRITKHLNDILDANLALVRRKLAYDLEKSEVRMKKLKKHFIDPLDMFPITVEAVRTPFKVSTLRQRRLPDGFIEMKEHVEQKLIEAELKGRPPERQQALAEPLPPPKPKSKELEYFLIGLSAHTILHSLNAKIMRLLRKYRMRRVKLERRQQQWERFNATKPVEGVNHPDDDKAYSIAVQTIGDYKLKTAHDYKVPKHLRENKMKKYKTLLAARERQFDLRHTFNQRIHNLRQKKVDLRDYLKGMDTLLKDIHKEIPPEYRMDGPEVIELKDSDFPENNLEVVLNLPPEMRKKPPKVSIVIPEPTEDLLEKEVLPCLNYGIGLEQGEVMSPWENEMKNIRVKRKIFQQRITIRKMDHAIVKFDAAVEEAYNDRLQAAVDAKFLDLHILTLNQELMILKKFEFGENSLADEIRNLQEEVLDQKDLLNDYNNKIDAQKHEIEVLEDEVKVLQKRFLDAAADNKFYDFLRKIFKKKYKPPKEKTDDDDSDSDSSSSSSSSSDDEEGSSIDSRDVGPIRLDESVCPKGCDQGLYDLTFALRTERHGVEQAIKDNQTTIETIKKDIEHVNKKYKATQTQLYNVQEELEAYQREKQQNLNQIMCVVILKLDQMQHLIGDDKLANIKDTLVFSKQILSRLYKRVGQLQTETDFQKQKHKKNIRHLGRMNTDCKYMEKMILQRYEDVNTLMLQKFGKVVNIDEITEACLRRMVFDMRMSMLDIRSMFEDEMLYWRHKFAEKQIELANVIKDDTSKLELLALLNVEKNEFTKILRMQDDKREHLKSLCEAEGDARADILKLTQVIKIQQKELKILRDETETLKTKGLQQRPPRIVELEEVEEEEEELPLMELDETDNVVLIEGSQWQEFATPHSKTFKYAMESRLAAREILNEFFDTLDLLRPAKEVAAETVDRLLRHVSIADMISQLLAFIPRKLKEEEHGIVETTAEKLYTLKPDETELFEEDTETIAKATIDAIMDKTYSTIQTVDDIANMLKDLVYAVALPFILEESSILRIMDKIVSSAVAVDKDELIRKTMKIAQGHREAMEQILQVILDQVYGVGIDYLYYIDL